MTLKYLNVDEIFEIAEQIERNGGAFYRRAAQIVADPQSRALLQALARMEDEHVDTFTRLRRDVKIDKLDPEDEGVKYLQAVAGNHIFNTAEDPAKRLTGGETAADILRIAINFEKDSVVLYLGLRDVAPPDKGRDKVNAILEEEKQHVVSLSHALKVVLK
ncbi:MAG: rubrerythrin [Myxococcales bacterium]|nr:MAG: rubrerythrin [Myxococcales bacterium]